MQGFFGYILDFIDDIGSSCLEENELLAFFCPEHMRYLVKMCPFAEDQLWLERGIGKESMHKKIPLIMSGIVFLSTLSILERQET